MAKPIDISFDLSDVVSEFSLDRSQVEQISNSASKALTMEIYRNWIEAAKRDLKSTRNSYIRGLIIAEEGMANNTITLTGAFNNMIENGVGAYDMKAGFMKSSKIKYTKAGGWYLTIPFRFATPDALGENESFSGVMPQEIYDIVKNFEPSKTDVGGNSKSGQTLKAGDIPSQFQAPKARNSVINDVINKTFDSYSHKSSIYEGMSKSQKTYQGGSQSGYNSFRRVGNNSDPMAWIHSGLPQRNFSQQAIQNTDIDTIIDNTVDKMLSELGF